MRVLILLLCALGCDQPEVPFVDGEWHAIAGSPSLGALGTPAQQVVDFALWRALDGNWQLWSCVRNTNAGRLFHRWEGASLDEEMTPGGVAMQADPSLGEEPGGLQAPFVFRRDGRFTMLYGDWTHICLAESSDGKSFARTLGADGTPELFGEPGDSNTRDPMALFLDGKYFVYYTAHPGGMGAVYLRTTRDFRQFSDAKIVARGGEAGAGPFAAECPHVVSRGSWHYLFRTQRYGADAETRVYRSRDPFDFGVDDDRFLIAKLPVAAPEIVDGNLIAALNPGLDGIRLARLGWR